MVTDLRWSTMHGKGYCIYSSRYLSFIYIYIYIYKHYGFWRGFLKDLSINSDDCSVKEWDIRMAGERASFEGSASPVKGIEITPRGHHIIKVALDRSFQLINTKTMKLDEVK